jgi:hypothetical protein
LTRALDRAEDEDEEEEEAAEEADLDDFWPASDDYSTELSCFEEPSDLPILSKILAAAASLVPPCFF